MLTTHCDVSRAATACRHHNWAPCAVQEAMWYALEDKMRTLLVSNLLQAPDWFPKAVQGASLFAVKHRLGMSAGQLQGGNGLQAPLLALHILAILAGTSNIDGLHVVCKRLCCLLSRTGWPRHWGNFQAAITCRPRLAQAPRAAPLKWSDTKGGDSYGRNHLQTQSQL